MQASSTKAPPDSNTKPQFIHKRIILSLVTPIGLTLSIFGVFQILEFLSGDAAALLTVSVVALAIYLSVTRLIRVHAPSEIDLAKALQKVEVKLPLVSLIVALLLVRLLPASNPNENCSSTGGGGVLIIRSINLILMGLCCAVMTYCRYIGRFHVARCPYTIFRVDKHSSIWKSVYYTVLQYIPVDQSSLERRQLYQQQQYLQQQKQSDTTSIFGIENKQKQLQQPQDHHHASSLSMKQNYKIKFISSKLVFENMAVQFLQSIICGAAHGYFVSQFLSMFSASFSFAVSNIICTNVVFSVWDTWSFISKRKYEFPLTRHQSSRVFNKMTIQGFLEDFHDILLETGSLMISVVLFLAIRLSFFLDVNTHHLLYSSLVTIGFSVLSSYYLCIELSLMQYLLQIFLVQRFDAEQQREIINDYNCGITLLRSLFPGQIHFIKSLERQHSLSSDAAAGGSSHTVVEELAETRFMEDKLKEISMLQIDSSSISFEDQISRAIVLEAYGGGGDISSSNDDDFITKQKKKKYERMQIMSILAIEEVGLVVTRAFISLGGCIGRLLQLAFEEEAKILVARDRKDTSVLLKSNTYVATKTRTDDTTNPDNIIFCIPSTALVQSAWALRGASKFVETAILNSGKHNRVAFLLPAVLNATCCVQEGINAFSKKIQRQQQKNFAGVSIKHIVPLKEMEFLNQTCIDIDNRLMMLILENKADLRKAALTPECQEHLKNVQRNIANSSSNRMRGAIPQPPRSDEIILKVTGDR